MQPRVVVGWTLAVLLAAAFLFFGVSKLLNAELPDGRSTEQEFEDWGYPRWFAYVTGTMETLGALLVLWPRTRFYGAALLCVVMLGAIPTHVLNDELPILPLPITMLALAGTLAWLSRPAWPARLAR